MFFWVRLNDGFPEDVLLQPCFGFLPVAVSLQVVECSPTDSLRRNRFHRESTNRNADQGDFRYVAPERLNNEGFIEMINNTKVRLIAIDEAHCISEWGHAFRPDYLKGRFTTTMAFAAVLVH